MYQVVSDNRRGVPGYYVEDSNTGETVAAYDCLKWAERKAEELNENVSDQRLQHKRRRTSALLPRLQRA